MTRDRADNIVFRIHEYVSELIAYKTTEEYTNWHPVKTAEENLIQALMEHIDEVQTRP